MDKAEKNVVKVRKRVFALAAEVSRLFKTDVSVQSVASDIGNAVWTLGVAGIGTITIVADSCVTTPEVVSERPARRKRKSRKRSPAGDSKVHGNKSVE